MIPSCRCSFDEWAARKEKKMVELMEMEQTLDSNKLPLCLSLVQLKDNLRAV
jgi:hypothetical protein